MLFLHCKTLWGKNNVYSLWGGLFPEVFRSTLLRYNTENSKQIFTEKELLGLSPNFHIHVSGAIHLFPRSVLLFCSRKICGPIPEKYKCSRTHECGSWDWGRKIPFLGIQKWDFRCSALYNFSHLVFCPKTFTTPGIFRLEKHKLAYLASYGPYRGKLCSFLYACSRF